jgi:hypothetical protein
MAIVKSALVDKNTNLVINIIMINDQEENFVEGYDVVPIPIIALPYTPDEEELYSLLEQVDPTFVRPVSYQEISVFPGITKWTSEDGFF